MISLREAAKQLEARASGSASAALLTDALGKVQGHGAVVAVLFGVVAPDAQKSVQGDVAALTDAVGKGDKAKVAATAKNLQATVNAQATQGGRSRVRRGQHAQAAGRPRGRRAMPSAPRGVRGAEQGAMALDRLYSTYSKAPGKKAEKAAGDALDRMFATIEDPKKYDAKKFATEAKAFGDAIK